MSGDGDRASGHEAIVERAEVKPLAKLPPKVSHKRLELVLARRIDHPARRVEHAYPVAWADLTIQLNRGLPLRDADGLGKV